MHYHVAPVANKHLAEIFFLKNQAIHEKNIKNAHSTLDRSEPIRQSHCSQRIRQKQIREYELARIERENQRLLAKIAKNGSFIDSHNHYNKHTLKMKDRNYEQIEHKNDFQHLQKRINQVRATYPAREYQLDYAKHQIIKKRLSRFS
ncbi:unnamed protein product [Adineta steineri]|uniref:Uncharacterized protein n=2 Tax=Adineta steineri TaxID=433720 RepID=A0A819LSV1_9BILA|nr:unnamed protein product [Adineta steineri]